MKDRGGEFGGSVSSRRGVRQRAEGYVESIVAPNVTKQTDLFPQSKHFIVVSSE